MGKEIETRQFRDDDVLNESVKIFVKHNLPKGFGRFY